MKITDAIAEKYPKLLENTTYYNMSEKPTFWEDLLSKQMSIVAAEPDKLTWKFTVKDQHCNHMNNLHGGCVATLIDICSSFAVLVATGKEWSLIGISTDLSVSYLRGVPEGEEITIVCDVLRVGTALGNIHTKIYNKKGELCFAGSHTKYCIDSRL
ncbi:Thioesterase/thiol ester dehydrase-isomerase [Backusella circina FSU 941]|nr:Thioesterase/thiol ester dehydrase-isomerase [Backusella circina FSU 941]